MLEQIINIAKTNRIQIISVCGSLFILFFIVSLIRKKSLKEEYSLLWLFFSLILLILSIWKKGLEFFALLVGIAYPPAALLLVLILTVFIILIQYSIVISKLTEKNKSIAQELGIVKMELTALKTSLLKKDRN